MITGTPAGNHFAPVVGTTEVGRFFRDLRHRLVALRGRDLTARAIADQLNQDGVRTARGKAFAAITVQTLLFRSDLTGDKESRKPADEPDWVAEFLSERYIGVKYAQPHPPLNVSGSKCIAPEPPTWPRTASKRSVIIALR